MSTTTTLTIDGPARPFLTVEWLRENAADRGIELPNDAWGTVSVVTNRAAHTGRAVVQWDDERWSIDGIQEFAGYIAQVWPGTVELREEWDTRDADEAGAQGWRWAGGVLVETGETRFVWSPVL